MHKIKQQIKQIIILLSLSTLALAEPPGWYGGFEMGETNSHYNAEDLGLTSADSRDLGFSSRVYLGYQAFHPFGIEVGYLPFKDTRLLNINGTDQSANIKQSSIDVLIKGSLKIKKIFYLSGRFGMSLLQSKPDAYLKDCSDNDYHRNSVTHVRPMFGLGASYPLRRDLLVEVVWLHILEHRAIPEGSFIGLGLAYYPEKFRQDASRDSTSASAS